MDKATRKLLPAIERIYDESPTEAQAAPALRKLAVTHRLRRHHVFEVFRDVATQRKQQ